ncbi:MAG: amidohydrolase family protein [Luteitalea sp.]|nr:amidohydrolase family protein [Luteitalea sp.]
MPQLRARLALRVWISIVLLVVCFTALGSACRRYDVLIRNGVVYDGTGAPPRRGDVAITGDRIAAVGDLESASAGEVVDAGGLAVAPGFINMLSWATESLLVDGRSLSDIEQGVTTEIFGEGSSMGPLSPEMKARTERTQGDLKYDVTWTTLGEYLETLEREGVSANVASFIGAATIREHVIGLDDRPATAQEMERMRTLVRQEMQEGALGIGSSLIYAPGAYASTEELIELCKVAAQYDGKYISHLRNESTRLLEAIDELLRIAREAEIPAEIYHLKAAGEASWPTLDAAIAKIEGARAEGLKITADMYTYTAGATGLTAAVPPSRLEGGLEAFVERLRDPAWRRQVAADMRRPAIDWESLYQAAGSPDRVLLVEFRSEELKPLTGKTLGDVARQRGTSDIDTILDLIAEDGTRVGAVYFLMSEDNVRKQIRLPWVTFGSDAGSLAPEGVFLRSSVHPRAYGNVARLLGRYVRDEQLIPLEAAIHRLSGLPASNLGLEARGTLGSGMFADVVVFDPETITDLATYEKPHQLASGVEHVWVNGVRVLKDGEHTGARPGRALKGPGAKK